MARPVEIDRHQAFLDAYDLFWQRGFASTSLQNLLDTLKIGRSSFYAAFNSKESLFSEVLSEYHNNSMQEFARIRASQKGLAVIRTFVTRTFINIPASRRRRGCLAVNTVLELADVDQKLHAAAVDVLDTLNKELEEIFEEAYELGELRSELSPKNLALLFSAALQGLRVSSRTGISRSDILNTLDSFIDTITQH